MWLFENSMGFLALEFQGSTGEFRHLIMIVDNREVTQSIHSSSDSHQLPSCAQEKLMFPVLQG